MQARQIEIRWSTLFISFIPFYSLTIQTMLCSLPVDVVETGIFNAGRHVNICVLSSKPLGNKVEQGKSTSAPTHNLQY